MGVSYRVRERLKMLDPISNIDLQKIVDVGIRTGSTVYGGGHKNDTDIDIMIPPNTIDMNIFNDTGFDSSEYESDDTFTSIYVKTKKGNILNLLFFHKQSLFDIWKKSTEMCKKIYDNSTIFRPILEYKDSRVKIFEGLQDYYSRNTVEDVEPEIEPDTDDMPF
jgi:hypothetical protein